MTKIKQKKYSTKTICIIFAKQLLQKDTKKLLYFLQKHTKFAVKMVQKDTKKHINSLQKDTKICLNARFTVS